MELSRLLFNLSIGSVWIYSGMILRFTKKTSLMEIKSYRIAKNYMVTFLIFTGIAIISTSIREIVLGEKLTYLCIYVLLNNFIESILILFSFISLYNSKKIDKYNIILTYSPVFFFILLYCISRLVFPEPEIKSFMELLRNMPSTPALAIKFLIILSIISGTLIVSCRYLKSKRDFSYRSENHYLHFRLDNIKWFDRMFLFIIFMEISSILNYIVTWHYYNFIHGIVMTVGIGYYTIDFISHRLEFCTAAIQIDDTNPTNIYPQPKRERTTSEKETQTTDSPEEIDESYYLVKKAVNKWVKGPDKPYLKTGITLKEAALGIGVSRRRLSSFIKNEYNCNFNAWISRFRIKEVERILLEENPNLSLSYIADCVGFSDLPAMSNKFKKIVGVSPSQFRRMIIQKYINDELTNDQS